MKIVPLFLKADRATGGLGLNEKEIGLYYGIYGAAAFVPGSLLAGYYISARGAEENAVLTVLPYRTGGAWPYITARQTRW